MAPYEHIDSDQPICRRLIFRDVYDQPDSRSWFNTLSAFDYRIPQANADAFRRVLQAGTVRPDQTIREPL